MAKASAKTGSKAIVKAKVIRAQHIINYLQARKGIDADSARQMYLDALEKTRNDHGYDLDAAVNYLGIDLNEISFEDRGVIAGPKWEVFKSRIVYLIRRVINHARS